MLLTTYYCCSRCARARARARLVVADAAHHVRNDSGYSRPRLSYNVQEAHKTYVNAYGMKRYVKCSRQAQPTASGPCLIADSKLQKSMSVSVVAELMAALESGYTPPVMSGPAVEQFTLKRSSGSAASRSTRRSAHC